jgi:hypothetical protein
MIQNHFVKKDSRSIITSSKTIVDQKSLCQRP